MSGAELPLGIIGALAVIHVAIKACQTVFETCSALKHAETEISERCTRLLSNTLQMKSQLELFCQIGDQIDEERQIALTQVLEILVQKLNYADAKLNGLVQSRSRKLNTNNPDGTPLLKRERGKTLWYALQKSSLDKAIGEVEKWQAHSFNPLWFAMMKVQSQHFDKQLSSAKTSKPSHTNQMIAATMAVRNPLRDLDSTHVILPLGKLRSAKTTEIAFSSVKSVRIDDKWRLVDSASDLSEVTVRELAVRLKKANPSTFGLLTCLGVFHDERIEKFSIVFRMPDSMSKPETLRAKIIANNTNHSLSDRFRLATQLARAVSSVHTFDMVHKSIRPENIIVFLDNESTLGSAFLLGFERVRRDDDVSRLMGDTDWEKNLYRHPQRQGSRIQERYIMQHDIYSLGVCMLEIGLWTSFVEYTNRSPTRSQTYNLGAERSNELGHPESVKSCLLSLAKEHLPGKMGTKYAEVVESCLTCLDLGNEDFGDESEPQEDGAVVAVRYIEKVLMQLSEISV